MASNNRIPTLLSGFWVKQKKLLLPVIAGVLVIALGFNFLGGKTYAVEVSGEVIAYVKDVRSVRTLADTLAREATQQLGRQVTVGDELQVRRIFQQGITLSAPEEVAAKLTAVVPLQVQGCQIKINGNPVLSVLTPEEGEAVIAELKEDYIARYASSPGAVVESIAIVESVELCPGMVSLATLKTKAEAKQFLATGTTETKEYTVNKGESFWAIANANSLTLAELTAANPEIQPDRLTVGQKISMVVPKPYITISSNETVTVTETVAFQEEVVKDSKTYAWERVIQQRGSAGLREVVYAISRQNGQVVDKRIASQQVIKEPVKQIVRQGTKQDTSGLAVGSGKFLWPVVGKITSYFGVRRVSRGSSSHTGIDIGVSSGTPVHAADGGVVTKAEYAGNYGRVVIINHGNGYSTLYAHNSSLKVKAGDKVTRGQVIALSGSTGRSTGPHSHFEIRYNDKQLNPLNFFK